MSDEPKPVATGGPGYGGCVLREINGEEVWVGAGGYRGPPGFGTGYTIVTTGWYPGQGGVGPIPQGYPFTIASPKPETDISDRTLDCEFAMEPAFQDLADAAEHAGWAPADVASALVNLADNHVRRMLANAETDAAIDRE